MSHNSNNFKTFLDKYLHYNHRFFLCFLLVLGILSNLLIFFSNKSTPPSSDKEKVWFGDDWLDSKGQIIASSVNDEYIKIDSDKHTVSIHKKLSYTPNKEDYLCFRLQAKQLKIYQNGLLIYSNTGKSKYRPLSPVSYVFYQIPTKNMQKDDLITIEVVPKVPTFIIQFLCLGGRFEIVKYILYKSLFNIFICLSALFLFLLIVVIYGTPTFSGESQIRTAMFWLGCFLLLSITWLITDGGYIEIFINNPAVSYWICNISVFLLPTPFIMYTKYSFMPDRDIFEYISMIDCFLVSLSVFAYLLNIYDLSNTYIFVHVIIAASILIFLYYMYVKKLKLHWIVLIAMMSLFISAFCSITSYWTLYFFPTSRPFGVGLVVYSDLMLIWTIHNSIQERKLREEMEREKLLQEVKDAEYASEQKSRFLSHMSHEIRTPLNAVLGMNNLIRQETNDDKILHYTSSIDAAGRTLLSLINDILDFSKIESGKMDLTPSNYSLSSVIHDLVTIIQMRASDKDLELKLEIDPTLPDSLFGDELRIKQIITNFLTNSVKYTPSGWIKLSMHYEKITTHTFSAPNAIEKILLIVEVSDSGMGIKAEDLPRLFDTFERLDSLKNRSIEGSGLGLSITAQLIKLMHGKIDVKSEYGKGSSFIACIPQEVISLAPIGNYQSRLEAANATENEVQEFKTFSGKYVLVVDDNDLNLEVLGSILEMMEIKIEKATSGTMALELTQYHTFDLILTDDMMPQMSGTEFMQILKKSPDNPNYHTPMIVVTANAVVGMKESYISKGFQDYITKPLDSELLQQKLDHYLG